MLDCLLSTGACAQDRGSGPGTGTNPTLWLVHAEFSNSSPVSKRRLLTVRRFASLAYCLPTTPHLGCEDAVADPGPSLSEGVFA